MTNSQEAIHKSRLVRCFPCAPGFCRSNITWLDEFIKSKKAKNIFEAGTENSDPGIDTNSEDNNNNTPDLSDLPDLKEPFDNEDLLDLSEDEEQTTVKRETKRP